MTVLEDCLLCGEKSALAVCDKCTARAKPKGFRGYNNFKYWLRATCRHMWGFFRYDIHQGIGNLVTWFPIIWRDRDWDQHYLLAMMEKKLRRMSDLQRDYGNSLHRMRYSRQLLVCSVLCKRLSDDNYLEQASKVYNGNNCKGWAKLAGANQKHEQELLGKLIGKHINDWWD